MRILIVIPAHNEEVVLAENIRILSDWMSLHCSELDYRILIADNGSSDKTTEIAKNLAERLPRVSSWHTNVPGRGRALRHTWSETREAEILVYMDADLSVDLDALRPLIYAIFDGADLAVGSRFAPGAKVDRSFFREIISRGYIRLVQILLGIKVNDAQCGFKAIHRKSFLRLLPYLRHPGWFFDTELVGFAELAGMKIVEVPVDWVEQRDPRRKSSVKIVKTIIGNIRNLISYRSRLPLIMSELRGETKVDDREEQTR